MERFFSARNIISVFDAFFVRVLFRICTLTLRVNIYVPRQGVGINRRNESTKLKNSVLMIITSQILFSTTIILTSLPNCLTLTKVFLSSLLFFIFPRKIPTLRNIPKLASLNRENHEEHPSSNLAQNANVPRSQKDYITQVSEKIESRLTKKLSN